MNDPSFPKHLVGAAQLYADIMEEIKGRIDFLHTVGSTGLQPYQLPPLVISDLFYIEFRMVCELIAVACLVAHGDISGAKSKKLLTEWKAGVIIGKLDKLHSDFYPVPEIIHRDDNGKWTGGKVMVSGFLTKAELTSLYAKCGDRLHRGSALEIRAQMDAGGAPPPDLSSFKETLDRIVNLLRNHTIDLIDPTRKFWVTLEGQSLEVKVVDVSSLGGISRSELLARYARRDDE